MESDHLHKKNTQFEFSRPSGAISCPAPFVGSLQKLSRIRAKWDKAFLAASSES
jgi:hypothetical protein